MKQLYVLRTHYYNDFIEFQWNKFQTELGKENCYLMMEIQRYHRLLFHRNPYYVMIRIK